MIWSLKVGASILGSTWNVLNKIFGYGIKVCGHSYFSHRSTIYSQMKDSPCSFTNGEFLLGGLLLGKSHLGLVLSGNIIGLFGDMELHVAVGRKVRRDTTVSSVGSSSPIDGSLGGNMSDGALFRVERLSHSIWFQVIEEGEDVLAGLLWESTVGVIHILAHGMMSRTSCESSEGNDTFVCHHILDVFDGLE